MKCWCAKKIKIKKADRDGGHMGQRQFAGVATVITNIDSVSSSFKVHK